jgi:RNA polymerase sigma factor (sigma-70 family)
LQEGFIKLFKNLHKFRGEGSFEGWIRRIFINTSIEHFRRKRKLFYVTDIRDKKIEDTDPGALDSLAEKDILHLVNELSPG